jgi:hypothetical protein
MNVFDTISVEFIRCCDGIKIYVRIRKKLFPSYARGSNL